MFRSGRGWRAKRRVTRCQAPTPFFCTQERAECSEPWMRSLLISTSFCLRVDFPKPRLDYKIPGCLSSLRLTHSLTLACGQCLLKDRGRGGKPLGHQEWDFNHESSGGESQQAVSHKFCGFSGSLSTSIQSRCSARGSLRAPSAPIQRGPAIPSSGLPKAALGTVSRLEASAAASADGAGSVHHLLLLPAPSPPPVPP